MKDFYLALFFLGALMILPGGASAQNAVDDNAAGTASDAVDSVSDDSSDQNAPPVDDVKARLKKAQEEEAAIQPAAPPQNSEGQKKSKNEWDMTVPAEPAKTETPAPGKYDPQKYDWSFKDPLEHQNNSTNTTLPVEKVSNGMRTY